MVVYRIAGKKYADDLSGTGAALYGGRWNKKGTAMLYTGENPALALLEVVVHTPPALVPKLDILTLEIPDDSITVLNQNALLDNWADYPAPTVLSEIGEAWVRQADAVALRVPSCVIHAMHNYLLNPRHPDYSKVKLLSQEDFHFDPRLTS